MVAIIAIGGIIAGVQQKPLSHDTKLLLILFVAVMLFALYMTFSPLLNSWPFKQKRRWRKDSERVVTASKLKIVGLTSSVFDDSEIPANRKSDIRQALDDADSFRVHEPKTTQVPDFSNEWAERDRLIQRCAGSVEEHDAVWAEPVRSNETLGRFRY